ncbi:hypothetical protein [Ramlibacter sp. AN1133]|uniref:hypothetical protein n=1 Tax=Ramlibacter sp. AN1133 TaxID=3133429 RepID=UPI0030BAC4B4
MGIKHNEQSGNGLVFLNIDAKHGVLTQKGTALPGASVEGLLTKFQIRPEKFEHNGQTIHKDTIALRMVDTTPGEPDISLNFTIASGGDGADVQGDAAYQALRTLAKLNAADLSLPIEIKPWSVQKGQRFGDGVADRDMTGVAVKQGGQSLKDDYGNGVTELPELKTVLGANGKPVIVQGKELKDRSEWNAILDSLLEQIAAKLPAMQQSQQQANGAGEDIDADAAAAAAEAAARQPQPAAQPAAANRPGMRQRA